jgi:hypothetical protein
MWLSAIPAVALVALLIFERKRIRRLRDRRTRDTFTPEEREKRFDEMRRARSAEIKRLRQGKR